MTTSLLNKIRTVPPGELGPRIWRHLRRRIAHRRDRRRDLGRTTYHRSVPSGDLESYFILPNASTLRERWQQIADMSACFRQHRFDLLGSGWVQVRHGMKCAGLMSHRYDPGPKVIADSKGEWLAGRINSRNLQESKRIWALVDPDYLPIDWQLDFKSGYRWSELSWAQDVPFGHLAGVDIKVPWELARLQHLPQLAISGACSLEANNDLFAHPDVYAREFRNVVLDFIATNPPRFGVNWRSAMDTAIRAANILVAYDLFRASNARFDLEFELVLKRSMLEHGEHILEHFGWHHQPRGNHYLAHLTGLMFISAYLASNPVTDAWLAFSIQELVSEVGRQFHEEGSNYEGSTSYHRLSAEMVVYATALVAGLSHEKRAALDRYDHGLIKTAPRLAPAPLAPLMREGSCSEIWPFPRWYAERVERMAEFTMHVTKKSGAIAQIGDNDSGRFLRLLSSCEGLTMGEVKKNYQMLSEPDWPDSQTWWDENILDHRHLVSAVAGLVDRQDFMLFADSSFETEMVMAVAKGRRFKSSAPRFSTQEICAKGSRGLSNMMQYELVLSYPGRDLRGGLAAIAYCQFGLYIFRSDRLFLAIRCGPLGQDGRGGHSHNDQLSIELEVDGRSVLADPGSYIYTPLPDIRNRYRSDHSHFGFRSRNLESTRLNQGLFELAGDPRATCLVFEESLFIGQHTGFGAPVTREVRIESEAIVIRDQVAKFGSSNASVYPFYADPIAEERVRFSPGYGKVLAKADFFGEFPKRIE